MRAQRVASRGAVLVAHSFGCLATLRQASLDPAGIAGALLVAPADPDKFGVASLLPTYRLPFPTIMVASRNDPWMPQRTAFSWGTLWGSELVDAGSLGHINADSALGDWAEGLALLGTLVQRIADVGDAGATGVAPTPWEAGLEVAPGAPYI
ncbi:Serine hydrolase [compost metagenome]